MKTPKPIPSAVVKTANGSTAFGTTKPHPYQLIILLDGISYVEVNALNKSTFTRRLALWKADTYPTLKRSAVRYFLVTDHALTETTPTRL